MAGGYFPELSPLLSNTPVGEALGTAALGLLGAFLTAGGLLLLFLKGLGGCLLGVGFLGSLPFLQAKLII